MTIADGRTLSAIEDGVIISDIRHHKRILNVGHAFIFTKCGGKVCIASDHGLFLFDIDRNSSEPIQLSQAVPTALQVVSHYLYAGTKSGVLEYDLTSPTASHEQVTIDAVNALGATKSELYVGAQTGLYELGLENGRVATRAFRRYADPVTSIAANDSSLCFVSTPSAGLLHLDAPGFPMIQILPPFVAIPDQIAFWGQDLLILSHEELLRWHDFPSGPIRRTGQGIVSSFQIDGRRVLLYSGKSIQKLDEQIPERPLQIDADWVKYPWPLYKAGRLSDAIAVMWSLAGSPVPEIPSYVDLPNTLNLLGVSVAAYASYDKAEPLFRRALAALPDSPDQRFLKAAILRNLSLTIKERRPDSSEASQMLSMASSLGENPLQHYPELADAMTRLGDIAIDSGHRSTALSFYMSALHLRERSHPADSELIAHSLVNVSDIVSEMGDYGRALELLLRAIQLYKAKLPAAEMDYLITISEVGKVLIKQNRFEDALPILLEAKSRAETAAMRGQFSSDTSISYIPSLLDLEVGTTLVMSGRSDEGVQEMLKGISGLRTFYGSRSGTVDLVLREALGVCSRVEPEKAEPLLRQIRQWVSETANPDPMTLTLLKLATDRVDDNPVVLGTELAEQMNSNLNGLLAAATLTERQRLLQKYVPQLFSLFLIAQRSGLDTSKTYSRISTWKGLWAESMRNDRITSMESDNAVELKFIRANLAALATVVDRTEETQKTTRSLLRRKDELERKLRPGMSVSVGADTDRVIDTKYLQSLLLGDEIMIDFYRLTSNGNTSYAAFILEPKGDIKLVRIEGEELERRFHAWFTGARSGIDDQGAGWRALKEVIWDQIASSIPATAKKLIIVPDGILALIPWQIAALDEARLVVQIDSIYELMHLRKDTLQAKARGLLLVGALNYDHERDAREQPASLHFGILRHAAHELARIDRVATSSHRPVSELTWNRATKARFIDAARHAGFIHVITHGFFRDTLDSSEITVALARRSIQVQDDSSRDPMAANGIALSGANDPDFLDGRLSAEEILELDLSRTELVVFSACETGSGAEIDGQGILGFRSSLISAGAAATLVSLWNVSDDATSLLMASFYRNLFQLHMTTARALQEAQRSLSHIPQFHAEKYWAGWVLVGKGW
jgi:CHAT domain-containing protein/tetratricopeptide (TPR) repeat protein